MRELCARRVSRQQIDTTSCRAHRLESYNPDGQATAATADNEYKMRGLGNRALLLATITAYHEADLALTEALAPASSASGRGVVSHNPAHFLSHVSGSL